MGIKIIFQGKCLLIPTTYGTSESKPILQYILLFEVCQPNSLGVSYKLHVCLLNVHVCFVEGKFIFTGLARSLLL